MPDPVVTIDFDDNRQLVKVFGPHDENLALLEARLDVSIQKRGNLLSISGSKTDREIAYRILSTICQRVENGGSARPEDFEREIREQSSAGQGNQPDSRGGTTGRALSARSLKTPKLTVLPRTENQARLIETFFNSTITFASGPAGTGKTYLAVAFALDELRSGKAERVILSRPALEAGERIGFLPGDIREKVDPFLRPLLDALHAMMPSERCERMLANEVIEIAPLAFMRGRTLSDAVIILDEAQNCDASQLKMFLTRIGEGSRAVLCGDPTQSDLPGSGSCAFFRAMEKLKSVDGIGHVHLLGKDIVRHPLIDQILLALGDFS